MKREDYIHASTRIRILEKKLVEKTTLERMSKAEGFSGVEKIWSETAYHTALQEQRRRKRDLSYAFEDVLTAERDQLYAELADLAPGDPLLRFLVLPFIYHDAKVFLRQKTLGESLESLLVPVPGFDLAYLQSIINNVDLNPRETRLEKAVLAADRQLSERQAAGQADLILDRALVREQLDLADRLDFLKDYLRDRLDFLNLTILERCRLRGLSWENCLKNLLPVGSLDQAQLSQLYTAEPADRLSLVEEGCATVAPAVAYAAYLEHGDLALLERDRDRSGLAYAATWSRHTYGPEVLFAYALVKEAEIQNLRLILTSVVNGISGRAVAERIR